MTAAQPTADLHEAAHACGANDGKDRLFAFDNSYARALEGFYVSWQPTASPAPRLLRLNRALVDELGLDADRLASAEGLAILSGQEVPDGAAPLAQAYAGHQFGGYSPRLGDGRALLLGELIDRHGQRRDIAFKGSGRTPFSRGGDGKAALGPVLREYLVGEAMHALGIPTTRALAAVATGEPVQRETLLPGALLVRVAASHLRVGTFQFFAAEADRSMLRRLADYAIARHYPALSDADDRYLELLRAVAERQAELIARWMGIGFIHGVMNTDNMTISGETIDYGPCAFMEAFDPRAVFSSIDTRGRYAFGNQPAIAHWNIARFAETLLPLIDPDKDRAVERAMAVIEAFPLRYAAHQLAVWRAKLGLARTDPESDAAADDAADQALASDYLQLLHRHRVDFTLGFRRLGDAAKEGDGALQILFGENEGSGSALTQWLARWRRRAGSDVSDGDALRQAIALANPIYVPRNHMVEEALSAAVDDNDLAPFERLLAVLENPFVERPENAVFAQPAPAETTACYRTFCGT